MIVEAILEIDEKEKKIIKVHGSKEVPSWEFQTWLLIRGLIKEMNKIDKKRRRKESENEG